MAAITLFDTSYERLKSIDWNFPSSEQDSLANIHPYPARFINDIPRELIHFLGCKEGSIVLDPFCGSGTTLYEAQMAGLKSIGIDLNPIACLISKVRTSSLSGSFMSIAEDVCSSAEAAMNGDVSIPDIPNLNHWFKNDIQKAIASLLQQLYTSRDSSINDALRLSLSSIIVRMSNQDSDTRYAAIEKGYTSKDVFSAFRAACRKTFSAVSSHPRFKASTRIICQDVLTVDEQLLGDKIGLVITSPPYPNAYEYWLYHKYRMWWLGYNPIDVRSFEIGARPNYHKRNGQTIDDFKKQMMSVFTLISNNLVDGGHVCFVIGRSIIRGQEIDNAALITHIATHQGLTIKANIQRIISSNKKSFNLKYGKIKTENILIFRKGA